MPSALFFVDIDPRASLQYGAAAPEFTSGAPGGIRFLTAGRPSTPVVVSVSFPPGGGGDAGASDGGAVATVSDDVDVPAGSAAPLGGAVAPQCAGGAPDGIGCAAAGKGR